MHSLRLLRSSHLRTALLVVLLLLAGSVAVVRAQQDEAATGPVVHIVLKSIIHPVAAEFVVESLEAADEMGAEAFVLELDTPGGLLTSTRDIFTAMLGAETPVVVFVAPSGAQAASAGFFLLMAADVAAMSPGTNTGAAHPVSGDGQEISGVMAEKIEQDAAASIRSLADRNGRNAELAEAAVVESKSFTAQEALDNGLIDLISENFRTLLQDLEGFELQREGEEPRTLTTAAAEVTDLEMNAFEKLLSIIAHPNVAYILLTLGGLGLYFELANPGAVLPGVLGAICLILAFFALSVLPVNYAGIALILLALIFFFTETQVPSFGLLTVAGIISLVLGSLMLFDSPDPALRVSLEVVIAVGLTAALLAALMVGLVVRAHRAQVTTGTEGLIHKRGIARTDLDPQGKVFVHGELWHAVADASIAVGDTVEVVAVDGMTLKVRSLAANPERGVT